MAEEQLRLLQEYLDTAPVGYQREIARLRAALAAAEAGGGGPAGGGGGGTPAPQLPPQG
jgi:hypothetical protein